MIFWITYNFLYRNALKERAVISVIANFKDDSFYPQIKRKYFTMIDWFSFVGGILGLFFGFSILSAVEIIFHFWMMIFGRKYEAEAESRNHMKLKKFQEYFKEFLRNSSIHSFQYLSKSDLRMSERYDV